MDGISLELLPAPASKQTIHVAEGTATMEPHHALASPLSQCSPSQRKLHGNTTFNDLAQGRRDHAWMKDKNITAAVKILYPDVAQENTMCLIQLLEDLNTTAFIIWFVVLVALLLPCYGNNQRYNAFNTFISASIEDEFNDSPPDSFLDIINAEDACSFYSFMLENVIPPDDLFNATAMAYPNIMEPSGLLKQMRVSKQWNRLDTLVVRIQVAEVLDEQPLKSISNDTYFWSQFKDFYEETTHARKTAGPSGQVYGSQGFVLTTPLKSVSDSSTNSELKAQAYHEMCFRNENGTGYIFMDGLRVLFIDFAELIWEADALGTNCIKEYKTACNPYENYAQYNHFRLIFETDKFGTMATAIESFSWRLADDDVHSTTWVCAVLYLVTSTIHLLARTIVALWGRLRIKKSTAAGAHRAVLHELGRYIYHELWQYIVEVFLLFNVVAWPLAEARAEDFKNECVDAGVGLTMGSECVYDSYQLHQAFALYEHILGWVLLLVLTKAFNRISALFGPLRFARAAVTLAVKSTFVFGIFLLTMAVFTGITFTVIFGQGVHDLRSWPNSIGLVLLLIIGEVEEDLFDATRFWMWGRFYLIIAAFVYTAILVTIFVAVVERAFEKAGNLVQREVPVRMPWTGYMDILPDACRPCLSYLWPEFSLTAKIRRRRQHVSKAIKATMLFQSVFRGRRLRKERTRFQIMVERRLLSVCSKVHVIHRGSMRASSADISPYNTDEAVARLAKELQCTQKKIDAMAAVMTEQYLTMSSKLEALAQRPQQRSAF